MRPSIVAVLAVMCAARALAGCGGDEVARERPLLRVSPEELAFGPVFVGQERELAVQLANDGRVGTTLRAEELAAGFSVTPEELVIPPGGRAVALVAFRPSTAGEVAGSLVLAGGGDRIEVGLGGRGIEYAFVAPETLDFGAVRVGTSAVQTLALESESDGTIRLEPAIQASQQGFRIAEAISLPARTRIEVPVEFLPRAGGDVQGTLALRPCPDCEETTVALRGRGVLESIDASPRTLAFGDVEPGGRKSLSVRVVNFGEAPASVVSTSLIQAPDTGFGLPPVGLPLLLDPGASTTLEVVFAPERPGEAEGTLRLQVGPSVLDVALVGRCLSALLGVSPHHLDLGAVGAGQSSTRTLQVFPLGDLGATVTAIEFEGTAGGFTFELSRDLPTVVGAPLEVAVTFSAGGSGTFTGNLLIRSEPGPQLIRVPLVGRVFSGPACALEVGPEVVRFGLVPAGEVRRRDVGIRNVGAAACPIWALGLEPGGSSSFTIAEPAATDALLGPGERLVVSVEFAPAEPRLEPDLASLTFQAHPAENPPVRVPITGLATGLRLRLEPEPLDFGTVPIGATALRSLDLWNEGERMVRLLRIGLVDGTVSSFGLEALPTLPAALGPGSAVTVPASFSPTAPARVGDELAIWLEDQAEPLLARLVGAGVDEPCGDACLPQASCPGPRTTHVHEAVWLTGAGVDPDGGPVTCSWSVVAAPGGSVPVIDATAGCAASFRPDVAGSYRIELAVADEADDRAACAVEVTAVPLPPLWIETSWSGEDDLDLHLFHPDAGDPSLPGSWFDPVFDCHFSNVAPYWDGPGRADDPFLDRDDRTGRGPEIVRIGDPSLLHAYAVGVHWFGSRNGHTSQEVTTRIYCGGDLATEVSTLLESPGMASIVGTIRFTTATACTFTPDGRTLGVDP